MRVKTTRLWFGRLGNVPGVVRSCPCVSSIFRFGTGKLLFSPKAGLVITINASIIGWGTHMGNQITQGQWSTTVVENPHINV